MQSSSQFHTWMVVWGVICVQVSVGRFPIHCEGSSISFHWNIRKLIWLSASIFLVKLYSWVLPVQMLMKLFQLVYTVWPDDKSIIHISEPEAMAVVIYISFSNIWMNTLHSPHFNFRIPPIIHSHCLYQSCFVNLLLIQLTKVHGLTHPAMLYIILANDVGNTKFVSFSHGHNII